MPQAVRLATVRVTQMMVSTCIAAPPAGRREHGAEAGLRGGSVDRRPPGQFAAGARGRSRADPLVELVEVELADLVRATQPILHEGAIGVRDSHVLRADRLVQISPQLGFAHAADDCT